jgi:RHH-type rel operon transcriptional repressor/antitoxin RelB
MLLRLSKVDEERLERIARRTGRTKTSYARKVILRHIEDQEDIAEADRVLRRVKAGKERTFTPAEVAGRLGLD